MYFFRTSPKNHGFFHETWFCCFFTRKGIGKGPHLPLVVSPSNPIWKTSQGALEMLDAAPGLRTRVCSFRNSLDESKRCKCKKLLNIIIVTNNRFIYHHVISTYHPILVYHSMISCIQLIYCFYINISFYVCTNLTNMIHFKSQPGFAFAVWLKYIISHASQTNLPSQPRSPPPQKKILFMRSLPQTNSLKRKNTCRQTSFQWLTLPPKFPFHPRCLEVGLHNLSPGWCYSSHICHPDLDCSSSEPL